MPRQTRTPRRQILMGLIDKHMQPTNQMTMQRLAKMQRLHGQKFIGLSKWFPSCSLRLSLGVGKFRSCMFYSNKLRQHCQLQGITVPGGRGCGEEIRAASKCEDTSADVQGLDPARPHAG
jgi:hypothetical protein